MVNIGTTKNDPRFIALAGELKSLGIPDSYYSLGHARDERTCLIFYKEKWLVYFSERGRMEAKKEFDTFDGARTYLISFLKKE